MPTSTKTQICVHRIQLLSCPGSTPANVTHQLMLCGARGMGWVCMIVPEHIVQSQSTGSTQNTSVGSGTPAVLMFTRYDYTGHDFTRYDYTGWNNPVVHAHHQSCCWWMLRGLGMCTIATLVCAQFVCAQLVSTAQLFWSTCCFDAVKIYSLWSQFWTIATKECFQLRKNSENKAIFEYRWDTETEHTMCATHLLIRWGWVLGIWNHRWLHWWCPSLWGNNECPHLLVSPGVRSVPKCSSCPELSPPLLSHQSCGASEAAGWREVREY